MSQLSMEEFRALSVLARARRDNLVRLFGGTKLVFGTMSKLSAGKDLLQGGRKAHSSVKKVVEGGKAVKQAVPLGTVRKMCEEFIASCADLDGIEDVLAAITSEALSELISEMAPWVGLVASGAKVAKAAKTVAEDGRNLWKSREWSEGFLPGDPLAAADAVRDIIKRDLAMHSVDLGRHTASLGLKIAGVFGDLGTGTTAAVGLANALAGLGLLLFHLGLDIKELRAGNRRLETPATLDLTVFKECPVLGCYLLTCSDTSAVANFFIADIGLPGWQTKIETLKKTKMDPLLKVAAKAIQKSRYQLEGLSSDKGTHMEKSFFSKIKSKAVNKLKRA